MLNLSAKQLSDVRDAMERAQKVARYDGLISGEYKNRLNEMVEEIIKIALPEEKP